MPDNLFEKLPKFVAKVHKCPKIFEIFFIKTVIGWFVTVLFFFFSLLRLVCACSVAINLSPLSIDPVREERGKKRRSVFKKGKKGRNNSIIKAQLDH